MLINFDVSLFPLQISPEPQLEQTGGESQHRGKHPADEQRHQHIAMEIMGEKNDAGDKNRAENQNFQPWNQGYGEFQNAKSNDRLDGSHEGLGSQAHDGSPLGMQMRDEDEVAGQVDDNADGRRQVQQLHAAVGREQGAEDVGHGEGYDTGDKEGKHLCTFCNMFIIKKLKNRDFETQQKGGRRDGEKEQQGKRTGKDGVEPLALFQHLRE